MYQRVLVPLDGSDLSEKTLPKAAEMANSSGATLHLLQVVSRRPEIDAMKGSDIHALYAGVDPVRQAREEIDRHKAAARRYLDNLASRLRDEGANAETAVVEGYAHEKILEYARENGIDLVVISTHGYGGFKRMLLGSVTDRIIRSGEVPVLVLPSEAPG
ncbi:MAG: universal stress protein [Dehalococcoidia bacterium]|nr:universal stress protein [Dehalococcoidia bacterium]